MEGKDTKTKIQEICHGQELLVFGCNLATIPAHLRKHVPATRYIVITDSNVEKLHGNKLRDAFQAEGLDFNCRILDPGEQTKCRRVKEEIEDWMLSLACNRDTCVVAFGGGVVGDLSGFVAATFLRGVPYVQIPTTLLAMVDSSIGGKTGIDTPAGKNLLGAFHHPKVIYMDLSLLYTLSEREFCNGMAEVIKTAAIRDAELFELLENNTEKLMERDEKLLQKVVMTTASIKAAVVALDDKESGLRCILNWGHTIGHAIEALCTPSLLHGECVAIGMVMETRLSYEMKSLLSPSLVGRITRCILAYSLPVKIPKNLKADDLVAKMILDKKNANKKIRCVILRGIGNVIEYPVVVDNTALQKVLLPQIIVEPKEPISGNITVPGSKSISNRILPMTALAKGPCRIKGLLHADDTHVMLDSLQQIGVKFRWEDNGETLFVEGLNGQFKAPTDAFYLGNAGTASRFLTTMCTLIEGANITLTGSPRLKERPIKDLIDALVANGCKIKYMEKDGFFPLEIIGTGLPGGRIELSATMSSQYVSSILLSAPYARNPVDLQLVGEAVSLPFIQMTILLMKQFGIDVVDRENNTYMIPMGSYCNPQEFTIECDASSASYPLAIAAITGGEVTVNNIGSNSLQGDAKFYTVLEQMGCTAIQTEFSTTVKGPINGKLKAVNVDMSSMTDTFMTVAVLAAVAEGNTTIYNIANQRVKECNRIEAMVTELRKCGVNARELEDGLEIEGVGSDIELLHGAEIDCYNDHRIAMSFAVLGCKIPGIIIKDKECVEKTYPEFWMDLETRFHLHLQVPQLKRAKTVRKQRNSNSNSIVIIGMRGSGKSSMSRALSQAFGWKWIDLDVKFKEIVGLEIKEYVESNGWPAFRSKEEELLKSVLEENPSNAVISTGGGIVESPGARTILEQFSGTVIQIYRDMDDVVQYLQGDNTRANLGEDILSIWKRRRPLYESCSRYEFGIKKGETDWKRAEYQFIQFVKRILEPLSPLENTDSFFLSLTYPNIQQAIPLIDELSNGVQALELRVDLLESLEPQFIKDQITLLKANCEIPLIFTLRSKGQGGNFGGKEQEYFEILTIGKRLACEFIDLEACWNEDITDTFLEEVGKSRIISSLHNYNDKVTEAGVRDSLLQCAKYIGIDVIKVVGFANTLQDNITLLNAVASVKEINVPIISINAGEKGKLSRVLNRFMTPVTHSLLPFKAAPGQLTVNEIVTIRNSLGMVDITNYYLYGSPIKHSRSPHIHNTGFLHLHFPAKYSLYDTTEVEKVAESLRKRDTGGGSITIPHKESIIPYLDEISPSAAKIGAVNTIYKEKDRLIGTNTDWMAIRNLLREKLTVMGKTDLPNRKALVIGAGGTARAACYALGEMNIPFEIYNRTQESAKRLASQLGGVVCESLESLRYADIVIGTVPPTAQFKLPEHLLKKDMVVIELVYFPRKSPLLQQAMENNIAYIEGIEILFEQGVAQFEIWTGKEAPRKEIVHRLLEADPDLAKDTPNFRI